MRKNTILRTDEMIVANKPVDKTNSSAKERTMILSLQGWRVWMMLNIVLFHIAGVTIIGGNGCAMPFFFMLSGFVLTFSYNKKPNLKGDNSIAFVKNRLKRIYPFFLIALSLSFLYQAINAIVKHNIHIILSQIKYYVIDAFLFQAWIPKEEYYFGGLGPAWFLSALFFSYLLFIPVAQKAKRLNTKSTLIVLVLLYCGICSYYFVARKIICINEYWTYNFPIYRFLEFSIGIFIARMFIIKQNSRNEDTSISKTFYNIIEIMITAFLVAEPILFKLTNIRETIGVLEYMVNLFFVCLLVWAFAQQKGVVSKFLSQKIFLYLSTISFEIYLLHTVVNGYVYVAFKLFRWSNSLSKLVAIIITFVVAIIWKEIIKRVKQKRSTVKKAAV